MPSRKLSAREKIENSKPPRVKVLHRRFADVPEGASIAIANPRIVEDLVRKVRRGRELSITQLRRLIALQLGAEFGCPVSTAIFVRVVTEAGLEELRGGKPLRSVAPFWRVMNSKMPAFKKLTTTDQKVIVALRKREGLD